MARSHLGVAVRWPAGIALTSWRYMWRTTPMRRRELEGDESDACPALPTGIAGEGLQRPGDGAGPLYHRRYVARARGAERSARELLATLQSNPDVAAPSEFATFRKTRGEEGVMRVGDEYVVRMAGPWDGPVRVAEVTDTSYLLVTLEGHLEAGQIEFSAREDGDELEFLIESWARSGDRLSHLLYTHLRMAKEVQLHMWTSFLERLVRLSGGRRAGPIVIETRSVRDAA